MIIILLLLLLFLLFLIITITITIIIIIILPFLSIPIHSYPLFTIISHCLPMVFLTIIALTIITIKSTPPTSHINGAFVSIRGVSTNTDLIKVVLPSCPG